MDKFTIKEQATEITVMRDVFRGPAGPQGERGQKGEQGPAGQDGTVTFDELTPEQRESLVGPKGDKGDTGEQGIAGEDGISPTVAIDDIEGGHALTITDRDHPGGQTMNIMDGADGDPGPVGPGVPAGGVAGQIPVKASATDYDVDWRYPQYSRPNLLVNWYFVNPVNQGGQTTWQNANEYTVDRWTLTSGTASLGASGLTLNGTLTQTLETAIGQPVACSALLSDGSMITPTYNDNTKTFSITATGQTIKAVKLEIGSYQTLAHQENGAWVLNELPDYGEELVKCNVADGKAVEYTDRFLVLESTYEYARDLTWEAIGGGIAYSAKMNFTYNGVTATTVPGYRPVAATIARFANYRPDYQWVPYIQYNTREVRIYSAVGENTTDFTASSHISVRVIFEKT